MCEARRIVPGLALAVAVVGFIVVQPRPLLVEHPPARRAVRPQHPAPARHLERSRQPALRRRLVEVAQLIAVVVLVVVLLLVAVRRRRRRLLLRLLVAVDEPSRLLLHSPLLRPRLFQEARLLLGAALDRRALGLRPVPE